MKHDHKIQYHFHNNIPTKIPKYARNYAIFILILHLAQPYEVITSQIGLTTAIAC